MLFQADIAHCPIPDNSIDLIFSDPPYPTGFLYTYGLLANLAMRILSPGGFIIAMAGGYNLNKIYSMFDSSGLEYFYEFTHKVNGEAPYIWPRFVVAKTKALLCYSKGRGLPRVKSVISIFETGKKTKQWHHWGQDVESARYYIDCFSKPGDIVYDPFVGGGTTLVASALIGRIGIGSDIDMAALEICSQRLSNAEIPKQELLFGLESAVK